MTDIPPPPVPDPLRCPIGPPCEDLTGWESPGPCRRRFFGLLPPKHRWEEVRFTGKYSYQQCTKMACGQRRLIEVFSGGHQPIARGWENVPVALWAFQRMTPRERVKEPSEPGIPPDWRDKEEKT